MERIFSEYFPHLIRPCDKKNKKFILESMGLSSAFLVNPQQSLINPPCCDTLKLYNYSYRKPLESEDILMEPAIERWCSMKEICEYLGVSRDTALA